MKQLDRKARRGDLPVTGAWREGDPVGRRQFFVIERPFGLEGGGVLPSVTVAYETWGELAADRSNAVLVCHALTGDSHAAGRSGPGHPTEGWWNDLVGPGLAFDTNRYFVVCANVLGGCQGTTGPVSYAPDTQAEWGSRFPAVTIRDTVRSQAQLATHLGVDRWLAVVGGSMGGMQALEWAVTYPDRIRGVGAVATAAAANAQQIAWSAAGRAAIRADANFGNGDYYDAEPGSGPHAGLIAARMLAMIHYRSDREFDRRFDRNSVESLDRFTVDHQFDVETYLEYQGEKLVRRFDANTYVVLNKMMDLHDIGRGRGGVERALGRIRAPTLLGEISTDFLYLPQHQRFMADVLRGHGRTVRYVTVESDNGHDGFLTEPDQIGEAVDDFLVGIQKGRF